MCIFVSVCVLLFRLIHGLISWNDTVLSHFMHCSLKCAIVMPNDGLNDFFLLYCAHLSVSNFFSLSRPFVCSFVSLALTISQWFVHLVLGGSVSTTQIIPQSSWIWMKFRSNGHLEWSYWFLLKLLLGICVVSSLFFSRFGRVISDAMITTVILPLLLVHLFSWLVDCEKWFPRWIT